ncbi:MAG: histone H1 [Terriglobia bacterium]
MADPIKAAKGIFDQFLSKVDPASMPNYDPNAKDPRAQAAGRKGGLKGGKVRADKLTPDRRSKIAAQAAEARWKNTSGTAKNPLNKK